MSRLADALLALILLLSVLLVGTLRGAAWAAVFPLALAAAVAALASAERIPAASRWLVAAGALWGASLLVSLVPLPAALVDALSPESAWLAGLPLSPEGARRLHQAPGEGALNLLHWATAGLVAVAVTLRVTTSTGRSRLRASVVLVGLIGSLVCVAWTVTGGALSFGVHPMETWHDRWLPPMDNPNHWSAWLSMVAAVALALPLDEQRRPGLTMAAVPVGALAVGLVLTGSSRGGLLGLSAALLLLAGRVAWVGPGAVGRFPLRARLAGVGAVAVAAAAALVLAIRANTHGMVHGVTGEYVGGLRAEGRLQLLPDAAEVLRAYPWSGVGRGAVADVLLRFQDVPGTRLRRFIEVLPVDVVLAHGVIVGGALLALLAGVVVLSVTRSWKRPGTLGAGAAVASLAVHELGDYATWGGGVLVLAVCLASLALRVSARSAPRRAYIATIGVLALAGAWAAPTAIEHGDSRYCFERFLADPDGDLGAFAATELPFHPASGALAFEIGVAYSRRGDAQPALSWLNRAQLLAPQHPDPHLWTARLLHRAGFEGQALNEYRLATAGDWMGRGRGMVLEVAGLYEDVDSLLRVLPADRPAALGQVVLWLDDVEDPRVRELGARARETFPDRPDARVAGALAALAAGGRDAAAADVQALWEAGPITPLLHLRMARILERAGRFDDALEMLRAAQQLDPDYGPEGWLVLGRWELRAKEGGRARAALRQVRRFSYPRMTADSYLVEAFVEQDAGQTEPALRLLERAAAEDPTWPEPWVQHARMEQQGGDLEAARRSLGRALSRDAGYAKALQAVRALDDLSPR